MSLERWEIQFLVLLAKNRNDQARRSELLAASEPLSPELRALAEAIIDPTHANAEVKTTADFFIRQAKLWNDEEERRGNRAAAEAQMPLAS